MKGAGNEWVKELDLRGRMDWEWIETYPEQVYFATRHDSVRNGDIVTMWTRIEYKHPQHPLAHKSALSKDDWDCAKRQRSTARRVLLQVEQPADRPGDARALDQPAPLLGKDREGHGRRDAAQLRLQHPATSRRSSRSRNPRRAEESNGDVHLETRSHVMLRTLGMAAALLIIAPFAQAADNGIYLGAGYAQSEYGLDDPGDVDFDDEDGGYKLIAGWRVIDNFGVELNYIDHGDATIGDARLGARDASPASRSATSRFRSSISSRRRARRPGRPTRAASGISVDEDDLDFAWGVGIQARIWSLGARLEYEQFPIVDDEKLDTISLSFTYTFL